MRLLAPAKINLHLRVAPPEGTGFHPLLSWFCAVGLFDTLTFEPASGDAFSEVHLTCDDPGLPCDSTNLVTRAANALGRLRTPGQSASAAPVPGGLNVHLEKRIPTGGGLGGGSSDAAWTLLGLNRLWALGLTVDHLSRIAADLGSDVPFFLHGASSICTGRGEIVRPVARPKPRWAVLVLPDIAMPTRAVYAKFDEMRLGDRATIDHDPGWAQWAELSAGPLLPRLINDLEPAAFEVCPKLKMLRIEIEQTLGRIVRMSGSGSSLFTLFDELPEAQSAVECIQKRHALRVLTARLAPDELDRQFAEVLNRDSQ
jgi:4-diphosphocytidyl-2C-methyl-D-erythritol kinase